MCERETQRLDHSHEDAVRAEIGRLLESPAFRTSKRCREFLEYIVEHTMNGSSGALKERSLGVALFQLPQDFDTGQHTIVRVTANEVRKKLAQHYLAENGYSHAVRIDLPPGSYSVEFRWESPPTDTIPPAIAATGAQPEEGSAGETAAAGPQITEAAGETPAAGTYAATGTGAGTLPRSIHAPARPNWPRRLLFAGAAVLVVAGALFVWRWQA